MDMSGEIPRLRKLVIGLLLTCLGGCAGTTVLTHAPAQDSVKICTDIKLYNADLSDLTVNDFIANEKALKHNTSEALDAFLDCMVGAVDPKAANVGELKAYRAYLVLTAVTRYAAFNYTGFIGYQANLNFMPYAGIADDAAAELLRIETADRVLRLSGPAAVVARVPPLSEGNKTIGLIYAENKDVRADVPEVAKLHRVLAVLMVVTGAEKPTVERSKTWGGNVVSAISAGTLVGNEDLLKNSFRIIGKGLTLEIFGNAYLDDIHARIVAAQTKPPAENEWRTWSELIVDSCQRLAMVSTTPQRCSDWK